MSTTTTPSPTARDTTNMLPVNYELQCTALSGRRDRTGSVYIIECECTLCTVNVRTPTCLIPTVTTLLGGKRVHHGDRFRMSPLDRRIQRWPRRAWRCTRRSPSKAAIESSPGSCVWYGFYRVVSGYRSGRILQGLVGMYSVYNGYMLNDSGTLYLSSWGSLEQG